MTVSGLQEQLRAFAAEREWEQFHRPRSLLLALVGEVGELAELFQWRSDDQASHVMEDPALGQRVRDEIADVLGYVLRLADVLEIDLARAMTDKIELNRVRYPVALARVNARKYTELEGQE